MPITGMRRHYSCYHFPQVASLLLLLVLLLPLCGCEREDSASPRASSWSRTVDHGSIQEPTRLPGATIDDARNQFVRTESRIVSESRIRLDDGGEMWRSTGWTYAPDAIDSVIHHVRLFFGYVRRGSDDRGFLLAICTTRAAGDALVGIDVLDTFSAVRERRSSPAREASRHGIAGGLVTSYVCDLTKAELEKAGKEGLFLRHRHQSGLSYELMYPAEFFRGLLSGIGQGGASGDLGRRRLEYWLSGGAQPTPSVLSSTGQNVSTNAAEAIQSFLSAAGTEGGGGEKPRSNFVQLRLPKGVTVELPKNWIALSDNQRVTLSSVAEAKQDLAGITRPESSLPFAANFYDDARNVAAMFNIQFYPKMELTQDDVRGLSDDEIAEIDSEFRKQAQRMKGFRLLEWKGTERRSVNGIAAFVVEYRRVGARAGTSFCVRLVRVLNARRSFTVTVSCREDAELLLRPICDRIMKSIRQ
jgi:hypothetical protein